MYNVYNKSDVFFVWDISQQKEYLIGTEKDLIHYIAKRFRPDMIWGWDTKPIRNKWKNDILDSFACNINEKGKLFQIFDGYGRCINPQIYDKKAFSVFIEEYKDKKPKFYLRKNHNNKSIFRYDPVPFVHCYRGGSYQSYRKIKHLKQMYANPEYKEFNRGSHKDVPDGWWDDFPPRCNQRSWKKHRKHQWKEKKE